MENKFIENIDELKDDNPEIKKEEPKKDKIMVLVPLPLFLSIFCVILALLHILLSEFIDIYLESISKYIIDKITTALSIVTIMSSLKYLKTDYETVAKVSIFLSVLSFLGIVIIYFICR